GCWLQSVENDCWKLADGDHFEMISDNYTVMVVRKMINRSWLLTIAEKWSLEGGIGGDRRRLQGNCGRRFVNDGH
ncbi:hypothetical protein Csa_023950, partial [Cucumis sativus]